MPTAVQDADTGHHKDVAINASGIRNRRGNAVRKWESVKLSKSATLLAGHHEMTKFSVKFFAWNSWGDFFSV
jgi:hypothetical protein